MILTSLVAVAFGTFGTGANGNNYYGNTISLSSGVVSIATLKNSSSYSTFDVKYDVSANCDFRETTNNQGNKEYWVHFNSWTADLKAYDEGTDSFNTLMHSTSYFNEFESSIVNEPNNTLGISFSLTQTSTNATLTAYCSWYDPGLDDASGINVSVNQPFMNSNLAAKFPNSYKISFDLDNLHSQLINAFNMGVGGYQTGYEVGYGAGSSDGYGNGYDNGYADGYTEGVETNGTAFTIFNGILGIGMLPINVFLAMLNWEVFGINISNFVMSIMTLAITIYVISTFTGKKDKK